MVRYDEIIGMYIYSCPQCGGDAKADIAGDLPAIHMCMKCALKKHYGIDAASVAAGALYVNLAESGPASN